MEKNKLIKFEKFVKEASKKINEEIKRDKKKAKKIKNIIGKKNLKKIFKYLEYRFLKLEKKQASYRYLLSRLLKNYELEYFTMQLYGLLDLHNSFDANGVEVKKNKKIKKGKKILKKYFYYIDYIMLLFIKYMKKKYNI